MVATIRVWPAEEVLHLNKAWRDTIAALSGCLGPLPKPMSADAKFHIEGVTIPKLSSVLATFAARLGRIEDILQDLQFVQSSLPKVASISWTASGIKLIFLNLMAQLKFSVHIPISEFHALRVFSLHSLQWLAQGNRLFRVIGRPMTAALCCLSFHNTL